MRIYFGPNYSFRCRNKFCFTGGYVEASAQLPGANNVMGLWPAIWTVGNLGRAGYGATLEGIVRTSLSTRALHWQFFQWPYSYDSCDVGTVANQTVNGRPAVATTNGDPDRGGVLSYLPGQRLSRCTCSGENHPGPKHTDGTFVGRSAPEIDLFEAQVCIHKCYVPRLCLKPAVDKQRYAYRTSLPISSMGGQWYSRHSTF